MITETGRLTTAQYAVLSIFCIGIIFICFSGITSKELVDWDEARHGVTAFEMLRNGNYLVSTYQDKVDYYNTKPPVSFWVVAAGYKIFGYNLLGLRFFSAVSSCLTMFTVILFCIRKISLRVAVVTGFFLLTMTQFYFVHNSRTGDPDALFLLFYTCSALAALAWPKTLRAYCLASFLAGLAFLTKSFHVFPLCLFLFVAFFMDFSFSTKTVRNGVICIFCAIVPVFIWAAARYQYDGFTFLSKMVGYDLLTRTTEVVEWHTGKWDFYFKLFRKNFRFSLTILGISCAAWLWLKRKGMKKIMLGIAEAFYRLDKLYIKLFLAAIFPILLFSLSSSKLEWYTYSAYPFAAMLFAVIFDKFYETLKKGYGCKVIAASLILYSIVLLVAWTHQLRAIRHDSRASALETAIFKLGEDPQNHRATLFLDDGVRAPTCFRPTEALAGKLAGDFNIDNGGTEAYKAAAKNTKAILITPDALAH